MITLGRYSTLEEAQNDASRLAKRGIEAVIANSGGALVPGTGPGYELQVHPDDLPKLEEHGEEIESEWIEDRQHQCPKCGGKNYRTVQTFDGLFHSLASAIKMLGTGGGPSDDRIDFECQDCAEVFQIEVD